MTNNNNNNHTQRKHFGSHWPIESVNIALHKGDVFKSMFRVNAHNRVEAYCQIDGLPVDVLISGFHNQNRAVEGDIVAIQVDPLACWTKMKGLIEASPSPVAEDNKLLAGVSKSNNDNCRRKKKTDANGCFSGENVGQESIKSANSNHHSELDQLAEVPVVEKLCTLISKFPSKRPTGRVVGIIEYSPRRKTIIGFLRIKHWLFNRESFKDTKKTKLPLLSPKRDYIQLIPTDPRFPKMMVAVKTLPDTIMKRLEDCDLALEMELVGAEIVEWSEEYDSPCAHIVHIFGRGGEVEPQVSAILFQNSVNTSEFSPEAISCVPDAPWKIPEEEFHRRADLRNICTFTIDPATASDLDDALSVEKLPNGVYRVGVHIADVSYFVHPHTALDLEAQMRSTSVYLMHHKLPMLPPVLSDNLGSLCPGVERLAFSVMWDINLDGVVLDRWIGRTVVKSCCKLSYKHAQDILDGVINVDGLQLHSHFTGAELINSVQNLYEISKVLKENRVEMGALSIDHPEIKFLFDENKDPYDIVFSGSENSESLVEELMLLANTTVAEVITRAYPSCALLRRHPEPRVSKLKDLEAFCGKLSLQMDTSSSSLFHESLESIRHELKDDTVLLHVLMNHAAKPMQLATYFCSGDVIDNGNDWNHYALAVPLYTHFTSPLRRYPDIVVHRTLAATLKAEEVLNLSGPKSVRRCFTGLSFNKEVETSAVKKALADAAVKYAIPCTEVLADIATHCNERRLATRLVKDAIDKLYMWLLLRNKEVVEWAGLGNGQNGLTSVALVFLSEARVLGLGPRFMSIYVTKLAIERRIYYDEVEGLSAEWLETTSTLILNYFPNNRSHRRGSTSKLKSIDDVSMVTFPYNRSEPELDICEDIEPVVFPLVLHLFSTIPVALHPIAGDDGPLDIGARLYTSSYF